MDQFMEQDQLDRFKGLVHVGLCSLGVACVLYNVGAWLIRKEPRLFMNGLIYGGLVWFELVAISKHLRRDRRIET